MTMVNYYPRYDIAPYNYYMRDAYAGDSFYETGYNNNPFALAQPYNYHKGYWNNMPYDQYYSDRYQYGRYSIQTVNFMLPTTWNQYTEELLRTRAESWMRHHGITVYQFRRCFGAAPGMLGFTFDVNMWDPAWLGELLADVQVFRNTRGI